jgi:hypothetical protein
MLRLLTDNEPAIRRSANSRLVVETLLLRWTMLDRLVDLERVLATGGGSGAAPRAPRATPVPGGLVAASSSPPAPPSGPARRVTDRPQVSAVTPEMAAAASTPTPASPSSAAGGAELTGVPFTLEGMRERWTELVALVRGESRFLAEALAGTEVASVAPPLVTVALSEPNPLFLERLERQADTIEAAFSRAVGAPVRLRMGAGPAAAPSDPRTRRISDASIRADRLKGFRAKDPTLDAAADELDLEIVE